MSSKLNLTRTSIEWSDQDFAHPLKPHTGLEQYDRLKSALFNGFISVSH